MEKLKAVYKTLKSTYGPQGWWPTTPPGKLSPEYNGGPGTKRQQLEVMVGSVLTQNTSWSNAKKSIIELNRKKLLSVNGLVNISERSLAACIKSSGYYNQKAAKLKRLALFLRKHPISELESISTPKLRSMLLSINGVGPETADSILAYALKKPVFVVDAYTFRIFERIGLSRGADYSGIQELVHKTLPKRHGVLGEFHALLVKHGKEACRKKPLCLSCSVHKLCRRLGVPDGE